MVAVVFGMIFICLMSSIIALARFLYGVSKQTTDAPPVSSTAPPVSSTPKPPNDHGLIIKSLLNYQPEQITLPKSAVSVEWIYTAWVISIKPGVSESIVEFLKSMQYLRGLGYHMLATTNLIAKEQLVVADVKPLVLQPDGKQLLSNAYIRVMSFGKTDNFLRADVENITIKFINWPKTVPVNLGGRGFDFIDDVTTIERIVKYSWGQNYEHKIFHCIFATFKKGSDKVNLSFRNFWLNEVEPASLTQIQKRFTALFNCYMTSLNNMYHWKLYVVFVKYPGDAFNPKRVYLQSFGLSSTISMGDDLDSLGDELMVRITEPAPYDGSWPVYIASIPTSSCNSILSSGDPWLACIDQSDNGNPNTQTNQCGSSLK